MKIRELRQALHHLSVARRAVSIEGVGADEEQYRLERDGGCWVTYYYERGNKVGYRKFLREDEACEYFLEMLRNDRTTRVNCT